MDTKYWGPGGWKLLHTISFAYSSPTADEKLCLNAFFSSLPYVLPCKYCRASLSEYIIEHPLTAALESKAPFALAKWLWTIHNCVNAKLRSQKLHVEHDPPFQNVKQIYTKELNSEFYGWEFLFSIVENHPYSRQSITGKPIKDCPHPDHLKQATLLEKNRWNALSPDERLPLVLQFWNSLPKVLPNKKWREIWNSVEKDWSSRKTALKTLWKIKCKIDAESNSKTFDGLCRELRMHRSGCGASLRAKTCRKKRGAK